MNDHLSGLRHLAIASGFGSQVDDHGALLHCGNHCLCNELGCRLSWDERSSDDNVDFFALLHEECHFSLDEFFAHRLGIATNTGSVFLEGNFEEFLFFVRFGGQHRGTTYAAQTLNLLTGRSYDTC